MCPYAGSCLLVPRENILTARLPPAVLILNKCEVSFQQMFPPHYKEYEAIFIPNQTPPGEQNPESPESPGGPRQPGSRDPESRSSRSASSHHPDSGFWPAGCVVQQDGSRGGPQAAGRTPGLVFPALPATVTLTAWAPTWSSVSTRPHPASVPEAVVLSARIPARAVSSLMPTPVKAKESQV